MPQVCVDRNLRIAGGQLGIEKWAAVRLVAETTAVSTGDGAITGNGLTSQPGRQMIDAALSWKSDSPLRLMMRLQVIRAYRTIICSNPNAVQIWDSWTAAVDAVPRTPDNYSAANGLTTFGFDVGTDNASQPSKGVISQDYPVSATEDWIELPAGSTLSVRYRCYVWTPPPWSNNASANQPVHEADARSVRLRLWAYPSADEAVR
ncbi:hypothetical protein D5S18_22075 [Nocardia panacis]|uniref:DUF7172 domain-containing protein n=1 Tax=Nocardia panacis TaxID=2340916 RepID=A0A3A4KFS2_9NOCA|nr:hypothetical protein [Nocardia panacis]RJO72967.1 hypothetical protein D5S18_22075 [Nocardia panacis]